MSETQPMSNGKMAPPRSIAERLEQSNKEIDEELIDRALLEERLSPLHMAQRFAPDRPARPAIRLDLSTLEPWRLKKSDHPRQEKSFSPSRPSSILLVVLLAVALVPSLALAILIWRGQVPAPWQDPVPPPAQLASAASVSVPSKSEPVAETADQQIPAIALTAPDEVEIKAGDKASFALALDSAEALPPRSIITISGLPDGATFSDGRPYGESAWSLRPDEIGDLSLALAQSATGEHDLAITLVSADGTELASASTHLKIASVKDVLVSRPGDRERIDDLIAHGRKMIQVGYLAGARSYYQRAAEAGSGEAAFALAATYDPALIAEIGAQGIKPDVEQARAWYARALALGDSRAAAELARLGQGSVAGTPGAAGEIAAPVQPIAVKSAELAPLPAATSAKQNDAPPDRWLVMSGAANMRKSPGPDAPTLKVVQRGTKLRELDRQRNWVEVTDPTTQETGWVYSRFLADASAESTAASR